MKCLLSSLLFFMFSSIFAQDIPKWITDTSLNDGENGIVICSDESLDPEKAKKMAEDKCLSSALRSLGVELVVKSKTVQTLTGSDSSEVVETTPITKAIKCNWLNQYIEKDKNSYRVWLKCQYSKKPLIAKSIASILKEKSYQEIEPSKKMAQANSTLKIFMAPVADKILIKNSQQSERIIDFPTQKMAIDLQAGDTKVVLMKTSYKDYVINVKNFKEGEIIVESVILVKDI